MLYELAFLPLLQHILVYLLVQICQNEGKHDTKTKKLTKTLYC